MTRYLWTRDRDTEGSLETESASWTENWTVRGLRANASEPAWTALLADRPELAPGRAHPTVAGVRVATFEYDRLGTTSDAWEVAVEYEGELEDDEEQEENPLLQPPEISLKAESVEVPITSDIDGKPLCNSVGELFEGITDFENRWVFNVQVNIPPDFPAWITQYDEAVNADAVRIRGLSIQPNHLLIRNLDIGPEQSQELSDRETVVFSELSFELHYNPRDWRKKVWNRGLYERISQEEIERAREKAKKSGEEQTIVLYRRIKDAEGNPVDTPRFLSADGQQVQLLDTEVLSNEGEGENDDDTPLDVITQRLHLERLVKIAYWTKKRLPFRRLPLR